MGVPQLLLKTLELLGTDDFKTFNWYLSRDVLENYEPIPPYLLDKNIRTETVSEMIKRYCEEPAVNITVEILEKMGLRNAADKLKREYTAAGGRIVTPSSSAVAPPPSAAAAPGVTMSATDGAVIFAPTLTGCNSGPMNFTINR